jgi:hypothetical protein
MRKKILEEEKIVHKERGQILGKENRNRKGERRKILMKNKGNN